MSFPRRGEVYWVNLDPTVGREVATTRPAVIISNDLGNEYSARVIVAPLTSRGTGRVYPFEVLIPAGEGGLTETSKVALDQIRAIDKRRLGQRIDVLTASRMRDVDQAIRRSLAV
ncbi:MAG TPA: type II toxin-antitoxin system PemK/MazF family toxin [Chloroflexota bacterium]|nr:type II toxin-antitoxin system PemK/MazF family toxin [Chloroflexota bacterium]